MLNLRTAFNEMESLRREVERAFDSRGVGRWAFPFSRASFVPAFGRRAYPLLNISEDDDAIHVEALAPGVEPESLEVSVVGSNLKVSGAKAAPKGEVEPDAYHRNERSAGRFVRSVELPVEVEAQKVTAAYKNGLLKITLPKAEAAKPRQIAVNVA